MPQSIAYLKSKLFSVSYITGKMPLFMHEAMRQFLIVDFPVLDHPVTMVKYPIGMPGSFIASANAWGKVMNSIGFSAADLT